MGDGIKKGTLPSKHPFLEIIKRVEDGAQVKQEEKQIAERRGWERWRKHGESEMYNQ